MTASPHIEKLQGADRARETIVRAGGNDSACELFRSRGFWIALGLKLLLGSLIASHYLRDLFIPFLNYFVESKFANPWTWFAAHGVMNSFPYPPVMLYIMAVPRLLCSPFLQSGTGTVDFAHLFVARLPIAAFDVLVAYILASWYPGRMSRVLRFYWYSPIVAYVCYWHGQLDIIPTGILLLSLFLLRRNKLNVSMVVLGLALGTKSHLWACVPYILVYLAANRGIRSVLKPLAIVAGTYLATLLPYIASPAFRGGVFLSPEHGRLVANQISFGSGQLALLIAPGAIAFLWFRFAAYEKRNWDLLLLYMGILFSVFLLFAPPQPGYVLWCLPFVVHYFCRRSKVQMLPYIAFAATYLGFVLLRPDSDLFDAWKTVSASIAAIPNPYMWLKHIDPSVATLADNLMFTVMQASLAGIVLYMYMMGVRGNIAYRLRTNPVMIGIAGDSGSGKDTLTTLLARMFEERNTTVLAGDDYHRWPRDHEAWKQVTHLSAHGNRLYEQQDHALAMFMGESIRKSSYDHETGAFTAPRDVDPNHVVIFQGLHCLSTPEIRRVYDLKVFLDPNEELRCAWKVQRDCAERGRSPEHVLRTLQERSGDRDRYILPQRQHADVVVRWERGSPDANASLEILALNSFGLTDLVERLSIEPDLFVEHDPWLDETRQLLRVRGKISDSALNKVREALVLNDPWLRNACHLTSDLTGCLQLALFLCLRDKLRWSGQPVWLD